ncbi:MAG: hypothetical protein ABJL67_21520, partial [Sulfitobacter sp.]
HVPSCKRDILVLMGKGPVGECNIMRGRTSKQVKNNLLPPRRGFGIENAGNVENVERQRLWIPEDMSPSGWKKQDQQRSQCI